MRLITRLNSSLPLSGETIGYHWHQSSVKRPQGYPFYHWLQTETGMGKVLIGQDHFVLKPQEGLLISPFVAHSYYPDGNWQTAFLTFSGALASEIVNYLFPQKYSYLKLDHQVAYYLQHRYVDFQKDDDTTTALQSAIIYHFLVLLHQRSLNKMTTFPQKAIVQLLVEYLRSHYTQKITNNTIQEVTKFSIAYTNKIFKNYYQMTPLQYLTDFRLRKAKELMISSPQLQIQEIAESVGFEDVSHFIKLFREHNQITPYQFKKSHNCID